MDLQMFNNPRFGEVRTIEEGGKVLFCGNDIAKALGYKSPKDAIAAHCKGAVKRRLGVQTGTKADGTPAMQEVEMTFIPEGDIYRLAARSKLPGADEFERWIFDEVLPSIRKTGGYQAKPITTAQMFVMQAQVNLEQEQRIKALENRAERTEQTMQQTMDIFAAPSSSPDDWATSLNHQINTIVETFGGNHRKFRGDRYAELELEAGVDLTCRQTRLRNRMRKNGATETECKQVSKLQVIARDRKLRPIFESIVRREYARLVSEKGGF